MAFIGSRIVIGAIVITLLLSLTTDSLKIFSYVQTDSSRFDVLHDWPDSEGSYRAGYTDAISSSEVSDVLLQAMGVFKRVLNWQGVQMKNLFQRPRATAVFVLDGLADEVTVEATKSYPLDQRDLHGDVHSDMLSMFSGDHVLHHMSSLFDNKGLAGVFSADQKVSTVLGVPKSNINHNSLYEELSGMQEDWTRLQKTEFPLQVTVNGGGVATVKSSSDETVFYLTNSVDLMLFAELSVMMKAVSALKMNDKTADDIPDVFILSVSSLQAIRARYGSASVQLRVASQLAAACVIRMSDELVELYDGDILVQMLSLVWEDGAEYSADAIKHLDSDIVNICDHFLAKYSPHFIACHGTTCELVDCIDHPAIASNRRRRDAAADNLNVTMIPERSYSRTDDFSAMFGIIAFITIVLIVAVFGISWAMWMIDPSKDSIIYQMTAPRVKTE